MGKKLSHIEETVDANTGELKTIRKTFAVKTKTKEEFFMIFLTGLNAICSLSRPSDIKILATLCERAEYNTGKVRLTAEDRTAIMKKLGIKQLGVFLKRIVLKEIVNLIAHIKKLMKL